MNHTEIVCIIDKSGSMAHLRDDTIGGFNSFLEDQKKAPGTANLTLILFDTGWRLVHKAMNVHLVPALDESTYTPGGGTALLDAVGRGIEEVGKTVWQLGADVVFVIITDGYENSSTDYKRDQVKKLVSDAEAGGWKFIFLGANQDAFAEAGAMGVAQTLAANYAASAAGTQAAYGFTSATISAVRHAKQSNTALTDEELVKMKNDWEGRLTGGDKQ